MYYYLSREVKRRVINELKDIVKNYPGLEKLKVSDKFPYDERPQYGVVIKNVSGQPLPLASDNHIGTVTSHVVLASLKGKKSLLFDWVRENPAAITEPFTDHLIQTTLDNRVFTLTYEPVEGPGNLTPSKSPRQVRIKVDGHWAEAISLSGNEVILEKAPPVGAEVLVTYFRRNLAPSGLYYFELSKKGAGFEVMVDCLLEYNKVIIPSATGTETTFQLPYHPIHPKTFELVENDKFLLIPGTHYNVDLNTGVITFLPNPLDPSQTLRPNVSYRVFYRYQGPSMGPFPVSKLQTVPILPGVTTAFSNWLEDGDKQVVIVQDQRMDVSLEYGGNFDVSLNMDVYSRDPIQRELIADLLVIKIFGEWKPRFDAEGLMIVTASINGETEDQYDENTDTPYYMAGIDIQLNTDWRFYAPLLPTIKYFDVHVEIEASISNFSADFLPKSEGIR